MTHDDKWRVAGQIVGLKVGKDGLKPTDAQLKALIQQTYNRLPFASDMVPPPGEVVGCEHGFDDRFWCALCPDPRREVMPLP